MRDTMKNTDNTAQEISEVLVHVGRCAKVTKGGRRFRFLAVVIAGDKKGKVGYGIGKAPEVSDAREKALKAARKAMIRVPLREGRTLHHDIVGKFGSGKIVLRSAPPGTGIIAGGAVRALFEHLGIRDVVAKSVGSTNPHNMLRAALDGLSRIKSVKFIAEKRGKKISEVVAKEVSTVESKEVQEASN